MSQCKLSSMNSAKLAKWVELDRILRLDYLPDEVRLTLRAQWVQLTAELIGREVVQYGKRQQGKETDGTKTDGG